MKRTYLVATDGSAHAELAEEQAQRVLVPDRDKIVAVSAVEEEDERLIEEANDITDSTVKQMKEAGFTAEPKVVVGHPGAEICDLAAELRADGIFVGRRGLTAQDELLLGSVSHHLVHHAPCPVTVVSSVMEE